MYTLDVIVPFYNEEFFLKDSVERLLKTNVHANIYLVDNNSDDHSPEIAKKLSKDRVDIHYIKTLEVSGKGFGIQTVIPFLKSSHVVIHDADLEYFPDDLIEMKSVSENNPESLILGTRFKGNKKRNNQYLRTVFANKFLSLFFSIIYMYKVSDIATCYKLLPVKKIKKMELRENGFAIEVEIIAKFLKLEKPSLKEVPIHYDGRTFKEGKKINIMDGFKYIFKTIQYKI